MSKAFTREDDAAPPPEPPRRRPLDLPPGTRNYLTPEGAARLRAEHDELARAASADPARTARLEELAEHLDAAEVVDPAAQAHDRVRFGAAVTLIDDDDIEVVYRIVGIPEADPRQGAISWRSPVATALLGAQVGDLVRLPSASGPREYEIGAIRYG